MRRNGVDHAVRQVKAAPERYAVGILELGQGHHLALARTQIYRSRLGRQIALERPSELPQQRVKANGNAVGLVAGQVGDGGLGDAAASIDEDCRLTAFLLGQCCNGAVGRPAGRRSWAFLFALGGGGGSSRCSGGGVSFFLLDLFVNHKGIIKLTRWCQQEAAVCAPGQATEERRGLLAAVQLLALDDAARLFGVIGGGRCGRAFGIEVETRDAR